MIKMGIYLNLRIISADLSRFISACITGGILLENVIFEDDVTMQCRIPAKHYIALLHYCKTIPAEVNMCKKSGLLWDGLSVLKRPCLLFGVIVLVILNIWLPTRVLFVQVTGYQAIPANMIAESALKCGVGFGASRAHVRSEKVKNALLQELPQLQWAGINTVGCVATITVKERDISENNSETFEFGNIVSSMDGIILECTVEKGEKQCAVGQAVRAGQVLVSGYKDNGISISVSRPIAEIFAMTSRKCETVFPIISCKRQSLINTRVNYYLQIGKNYLNFNNSSRIYDGTCVKMYHKIVIELPGRFQLPIAIIKETCQYYTLSIPDIEAQQDPEWIFNNQQMYLNSQMIGGRVLSSECKLERRDEIFVLHGRYRCVEMICQFKQEEIIQ